jgi:CO dehydrogenase/acetyl-CoA synthase beta subunit
VKNKKIVESIEEFLEQEVRLGKKVNSYQRNSNPSDFFKKHSIKVYLDKCKEIILSEETKFELGGMNKQSFSLIYPINESELVEDGKIVLLGKEIRELIDKDLDFGLFILIGCKEITEKHIEDLKHFSFISNGIEGFMVRSVPQKFWCRLNSEIVKKNFSFEFLGNAIMYLYKEKFGNLIEAIEILFINSYGDSIEKFIEITSEIRQERKKKWAKKVEEWKKRADCDYEWDCKDCPFVDTCDLVRDVLEERKKIEKT